MTKDPAKELQDFKSQMKVVVKAMYRDACWQTLPWGPKQFLFALIADDVSEEERRLAAFEKPWTPPPQPQPVKKKLPAPWDK